MSYAGEAELIAAHNAGAHRKLPRQKCPSCRAARVAQVERSSDIPCTTERCVMPATTWRDRSPYCLGCAERYDIRFGARS